MTRHTDTPRHTPKEYAFWPSKESPRFGLILSEDEQGRRWTLVGNSDLVQMFTQAATSSATDDLVLGGKWYALPGWPDEWTIEIEPGRREQVDAIEILSTDTGAFDDVEHESSPDDQQGVATLANGLHDVESFVLATLQLRADE